MDYYESANSHDSFPLTVKDYQDYMNTKKHPTKYEHTWGCTQP